MVLCLQSALAHIIICNQNFKSRLHKNITRNIYATTIVFNLSHLRQT